MGRKRPSKFSKPVRRSYQKPDFVRASNQTKNYQTTTQNACTWADKEHKTLSKKVLKNALNSVRASNRAQKTNNPKCLYAVGRATKTWLKPTKVLRIQNLMKTFFFFVVPLQRKRVSPEKRASHTTGTQHINSQWLMWLLSLSFWWNQNMWVEIGLFKRFPLPSMCYSNWFFFRCHIDFCRNVDCILDDSYISHTIHSLTDSNQ